MQNHRLFTFLCLFFLFYTARSQPFAGLGYGGGTSRFAGINALIDDFNSRNYLLTVKMAPLQVTGGPHLSAGYYFPRMLLEGQYTWDGFTRFSNNSNGSGLSSITNFKLRYNHFSLILGLRPFETRYITMGMAFNGGSYRTLFSQGNGFREIGRQFSFGNDVFLDFWLIRREKFGFRIRPFYQFLYQPISLSPLYTALGNPDQNPDPVLISSYLNNFGMKFSILYIFGNN